MGAEPFININQNLIGESQIEVVGIVPDAMIERATTAISHAIIAVHQHYSSLGIRPTQQLLPVQLRVQLFDDMGYRQGNYDACTWPCNFVLKEVAINGLLVNSIIFSELPENYLEVFNHELRHAYLKLILGETVFASSFLLREGCAGLPIDSTARLKSILHIEEENNKLYLPLSVTHWDRELDKRETSRRCFIFNPWYLSMFSFIHDYIGVQLDEMVSLIETYKVVPRHNGDLQLAWTSTHPDKPSLEQLQQQWLQDTGLIEFVNEAYT